MAKKRNYTPGYNRIAAKLTKLLKEKIQYYDLIDTELMLDTIYCTYDGDTIVVHAQHYFKYLDEGTQYIPAYNMIQDCINSKEFQTYVSQAIADDIIEYEIKDLNK